MPRRSVHSGVVDSKLLTCLAHLRGQQGGQLGPETARRGGNKHGRVHSSKARLQRCRQAHLDAHPHVLQGEPGSSGSHVSGGGEAKVCRQAAVAAARRTSPAAGAAAPAGGGQADRNPIESRVLCRSEGGSRRAAEAFQNPQALPGTPPSPLGLPASPCDRRSHVDDRGCRDDAQHRSVRRPQLHCAWKRDCRQANQLQAGVINDRRAQKAAMGLTGAAPAAGRMPHTAGPPASCMPPSCRTACGACRGWPMHLAPAAPRCRWRRRWRRCCRCRQARHRCGPAAPGAAAGCPAGRPGPAGWRRRHTCSEAAENIGCGSLHATCPTRNALPGYQTPSGPCTGGPASDRPPQAPPPLGCRVGHRRPGATLFCWRAPQSHHRIAPTSRPLAPANSVAAAIISAWLPRMRAPKMRRSGRPPMPCPPSLSTSLRQAGVGCCERGACGG